ncbi:MAG: tryptophan synthase subunit beta, partial [Planctomycetes bacterium]|nr:tryptophan synthase subunit beta [Planctomycetota bacterium]
RSEGIIPAFESTHAVAWVLSQAGKFKPDDVIVINMSGRGDKDVEAFIRHRPDELRH